MGRVVKLAEVRMGELVDCAQALFFTQGYDNTTIADIIARAGVSKGGFYHHFESKEELLDAVIARVTDQVVANGRDILEDESLDALTKLNRFFSRSQQWKADAAPSMRGIFLLVLKPENAPLYQRMVKAGLAVLAPVLTRIVEQGTRENLFDVADPEIVAELLLHLANTRFALSAEAIDAARRGEVARATDLLVSRIRREEAIVDRLLGLPAGSVRFVESDQMKAILEAIK